MRPIGTSFGVGLVSGPTIVAFAAAAVASLRQHNPHVPVTVYIDEASPGLQLLAPVLALHLERVVTGTENVWAPSPAERESISAQLLKIKSLVRTSHDRYLYLDKESLVLGDVGDVETELDQQLGGQADVFMVPHRPEPTVWANRQRYFDDPEINKEIAIRLLNETYALSLPVSVMGELRGWDSDVVYGSGNALRLLGNRWLELHRRMLGALTRPSMFTKDELSLSIALWELRDLIRVGELPDRWNFKAGRVLGLGPDTSEVHPSALAGARILRLDGNRLDAWAVRQVRAALDGLDIEGPFGRIT
ncbi:hypothetical protein [Micromonospora sp. NBC_01813]|uniref:hypothetical protein n=1 Tax=Micromonospora sp. NBC_01813 TaxID=2975988 RepID=UPI002DDA429C|nr:hypothetical protein [Micromonospora sp. NBC_01813]WSA07950.1 hypothetical protein OG958_27660 [Micromonospora sp. NBC_01813]